MTDEPGGLADHPRPVAAQHQVTAKALPERRQALDGRAKIHCPAGQADRIDRPGGRAHNHRKRIVRAQGQQLGNRRQHTHLIRRPSPAAGKNQPCDRFSRTHRNAPWCMSGSAVQPRFAYSFGSPGGRLLKRRWAQRYCSGQSRNTPSIHWLMRKQSASSVSPGKPSSGAWITRR
ncbi:hypothetical protein D3C76_810150 [compost metagenome]